MRTNLVQTCKTSAHRINLNRTVMRVALIGLFISLGIGNAWAGGKSSNYYASLKISAEGPTGAGSVYVANSNSKPGTANPNTAVQSAATTTSGGNVTMYWWMDINPGYNVSLSGKVTGGPYSAASASGNVSCKASTSKNGVQAYTATATFVAVTVNSVDAASKDLAPTDPSADYPFTVTFETSNLKTIALDLNKSPETADGKFTITNWAKDGNNVVATGKFNGGGSYGGASRNNSTTVSLQSKASGSTAKTCTITANFPAMAFVSVAADDVYATQGESGKTGSATFKYNYAAEDDFPTTPTLVPTSGTGTFTVTGYTVTPDFSKGETTVTVDYSFDTNNGEGETPATLTLTAVNGDVHTVTVTGHSEALATNDASVTPAGGSPTEYATFAQALAAANGLTGSTLTLLRNVNLGTITATNNINKAMTIDLNGKELRAAVNATSVGILNVNAAVAVTIKDSKTGGKIINEIARNAEIRTITVTKGTLTLESGTIAVNNTGQYASKAATVNEVAVAKYASCSSRVIHQAAGTTVNINGGKLEALGTRSVYGIVQASSATTNAAGTTVLNVTGGEIAAEAPYNAFGIYAYGKVNMSAGVINTHITTNLVDASYAADNGTNTNNGYGYGIYMTISASATAASCYYGQLAMTGGTINVVSDRTKAADVRNYGIYLNATVAGVGAGKTASDGTLSQKACAVANLDGATVNVTSGTYYSYGILAHGSYNSADNSHTVMQIKNSKFTVKAYLYTYGIYANVGINGSTGGCFAADMELTADTVWAESTTTHTAFAVMSASTATTLYKNSTSVYYGEYAVGAKVTINSGKYTAKTKTTTAYAVASSTRSKSTYDPETSVSTERKLSGEAEAYAELIIHGGTFRGEATTTTSRAVSSGGYTTIDGGTFEAYSGTTTSYGLYAVSGKLTASGVSVSASGTTTAYGVVADAGITRNAPSGFAYSGEVELNNCTITATSRTGATCRGVFINGTSGIFTDATFVSDSTSNKWSAANAIIYHAIYPTGASRAIAGKATINGGSITANAATTDAYGIYQVITPVATDGVAKDAGMLSVKNATIYAESKGGNTAHGIYAGGKANIEGCTITAKTSAANAYGVDAYDDAVKVKKSTITTTAGTSGSYGILASGAVHSAGVKRESVMTVDSCTVTTTAGTTTSYAVYATGTSGGAYATDYYTGSMAVAGTITVNGGKYTSSATTSTAYAAAVADPITKNEATATPSVIINEGKFKGTAGATPYADVSVNGEPGYFVLNGGYYVKDENLDKKLGEGMNKVAVKSGTTEYTEGYRWRITDNMNGEYVCKIKENSTSYQSLEEALQVVNASPSSTWTIIMIANATLSKGDYNLPQNTTLLIPYLTSQTAIIGTGGKSTSPVSNVEKYETPYPLCKLSFADGVNMTVHGTIEASAVTYMSNQGLLTHGTGVVSGSYGWLYLAEGSHMDLESTAKLIAWGFVTGKGEINAKSGSKIYEDFQIGDWRGGTVESDVIDNKNGLDSKSVFVITHYYYQNIECPITYRPGATAYGWGGTYMYNNSFFTIEETVPLTEPVAMVGTSDAMFCMSSATSGDDTWVRKEYDPETDYVNWTLNSGASLGSIRIQLDLPIVGKMDVNSSNYVLPITSNFNIVANYGEVALTNHVCFIPGSKLTIKKEATVIIPSGQRAFFYDQDDWSSYSGYWFCPGYSPSWKKNPRLVLGSNSSVKMPDAEVLVEGTLDIRGAAYTTAGGANIHSTRENAGKVKFTAAPAASTAAVASNTNKNQSTTLFQFTGSGPNYTGKALNPAKLKNEDGTDSEPTSSNTSAGKTWIYMADFGGSDVYKWTLATENGCMTTVAADATKDYIHPSDWVPVGAVNSNHAYPSEDGTRMFVNAIAPTTNTGCVWWEVNPTPEVIGGTTYYIANNENFDNYGTYYYWDNSTSYWKPKKVTVIWKDKDGNKITNGSFGDLYNFNTSPVFHGTNPSWANSATEKHDWIGWHDEEGNIYDKNATLPLATADVTTYIAYFVTSPFQYTITFKNKTTGEGGDGKVIWSGLMDAGDPAVCPVEPTQESTASTVYTFSNWVGYATGATLPTITGPATYTAHYTTSTRQYHVTFYNYDAATVLFETDVDYNTTRPVYGGVTPFRSNTSAYSYEWTGWQQGATHYGTTADLALVTGDVYYVATFSQTDLKYQVLFKRQDGSIIDAPFFNFEETPTAFPANPTLASTVSTDYTFDHWDPATLTSVTKDGKVYTAYFSESPRQYTAHFVNYDGASLNVDQTIDYNTVPTYTGAEPMKPNDSRNSFEFSGWAWSAGDGWEAGSIGVGEAFPAIKGDITFTAQYNPVLLQFDVIYQREDGTVILRDKKKWGESTAFPTSGLDYEDATYSYTFDHWSPATLVNPVTTDATYTAYYNQSIKTYSITAVGISPAGYGSVLPASLASIPGGSAVTVNGNKITVNGTTITATPAAADAQYTYTFDHWSNVPATVTGNISDIEAVFTRTTNTYTVTWKNGDTTLETDEEVAYGTAPTFDGDEPTKTTDATYGYTFDGWDDGTSVYAVDALPTVSGAVTYTAHYSTAPTVASVTVGGATTYYATLQAAFNYAAGKTTPTITVLKAVSSSPKLTYTNSSNTTVTFDLNGYKVAGGANPLLYITGNNSGKFIIKDGSVEKTGQLYNRLSANGARACVHVYNCPTEFQSGTIYMENTSTSTSVAAYGVNVRSSRKFDMTGGTIKVVSKKSAQGIYTAGTTTISNGTIDVTETANGTAYGVHVVNGTTTINGNLEDPTYPKVSVTATTGPRGVIVGGLKPALNSAKTSVSQYNGKLYVNGGTYTVTASADGTTAYGVYAYRNTYALNYSDNATCPGNYVSAGTATITAGDFTVTASGADATAYGVCIQSATSIQTALQEDGTTKYAKKTATPKGSITGGKYIVSGATKGAVNTSSAATAFTVQGGWYNIETGLATYTAPAVEGNYRVLDLTSEDPYKYEVAEAYTVTFNNHDGSTLQSSAVKKGATPVYSGETPTKAEDASYTYSFTGWSPEITTVSAAATYTAQFSSTPKAVTYYYIDPETGEETSVSSASTPSNPADYDTEDYHYTFDEWVADGPNYRAQYSSSERTYGAKLDIVDWTKDYIVVNATNLRAVNGGTAWKIKYASADYTKLDLAADRTVLVARDKVHETANGYVVIKLQGMAGVESRQKYTVPLIYDEDATLSGTTENSIVYVHSATTLRVDASTSISRLYVSPGANVEITNGTLTITDMLALRTLPWQTAAINGNFTAGSTFYTRIGPDKNKTIAGLNGSTTYAPTRYYQLALPLSCSIADVRLSDGTTPAYESTWALKYYSESERASQGSEANNWVFVPANGTIEACTGYEFFSSYKYYREYYFPVTPPASATTVTVSRTGKDDANSGWNMICSPLMSRHMRNPHPEDIIVSWLNEEDDYTQEIPDFIHPAIPFFYQTKADGEQLSFAGTDVEPSLAPRRKAADEEQVRIQWLHLDITDENGQGDQTSIYSHPTRYDAVYKTGIDAVKQTLTASRALMYSSHTYGEMAFAGVSDALLENGVALTVYSPKAQELTISMRENDWLNRMAFVWLIDQATGAQIDLLESDYSFNAEAGTTAGRFILMGAFFAPQITTDNGTVQSDDEDIKAKKFIYNDKMYVQINGVIYDATGKLVK